MLALLVLLALLALRASDPDALRHLRTRTFDVYQTIHPREPVSRPVVIIDIDDASLTALGQWPWPRTVLADLVVRLFDAGVPLIGFDIVFPEPDRSSPAVVADHLRGLDTETVARLRALPSNSAILAQAMARGPVVLGQGIRTDGPAADEHDGPTPASIAVIGQDPRDWMTRHGPVLGNVPVLDRAATGRGVFALETEDDGIVRRVPMILNADGTIWPSLSTELLRLATGNQTLGIRTRGNPADGDGGLGIEGLILRPYFIPTDALGRLWVYFARHDPSLYVSAADLMAGRVGPERLQGRIALIGTSATGLLDIKSTPVSPAMPGVEVHAQVIETVIDGTALRRSRVADAVEIMLSLVAGAGMIVLVPMIGAVWTLVLLGLGVGAMVAGSWLAFSQKLMLLDPVFPALVAIVLHILLSYAAHVRSDSQRRQIRTAFSRYMAPEMVKRLAEDPASLQLGGETRDLTLMFCDIRGFTTLSETLDAQGVTRLMNRFLTPMTEVVMAHGGTIDKYIGDCIMAFWNAPLDDPDHATNAARAALAILDRLDQLNADMAAEAEAEGREPIRLRIGIGLNTGPMCVGNVGSDQRFDYSVLGDGVNLAARLQDLSKAYSQTIILSEATATALHGLATVPLDSVTVRGRRAHVRVFGLVGDESRAAHPALPALVAAQSALLDALEEGDTDAARAAMAKAATHASAFGLDLSAAHAVVAQRLLASDPVPEIALPGGSPDS